MERKAEVHVTNDIGEVRAEQRRQRLEWRHPCLTHLIKIGDEQSIAFAQWNVAIIVALGAERISART